MAKSSQAARNSRLSAARSSASRRRQAGSILKNVNLAKVRSAIGVDDSGRGFARGWAGRAGVRLTFRWRSGRPRLTTKKYKTLRPRPTPPGPKRSAANDPGDAGASAEGHERRGAGGGGPVAGAAQRGLGFCPRGADLPRHHAGQPRLRLALRLASFRPSGGTARLGNAVVDRADSAPADIVPGLLASTFEAAGVGRPGGGSERLVLFRRPNLGRPAAIHRKS